MLSGRICLIFLILIMASENGSGARPKDRSVSSGRSLRNVPVIDYKKFSEGDFCFSEDEKDAAFNSGSDADFKRIPPGTSDADLLYHQQGEQPVLTNMADIDEIQKLKLELASLSREEESLKKRKEADELRRQVTEKRKSVISLRGKLDISRSKNKSSIKQSKSKGDRRDNDGVNIMTLRHSKSLRRKVNREMKQLGLFNSDEINQSSQESLSSGCESKDAEKLSEGATDCKKKKKKAVLLSSESSDSASQYSHSSAMSDDYKESKKKSKKKIIKSSKVSGDSAYSKQKSNTKNF